MSAGITEREKFEFDLNGFLVLRNVLSAEEVASANAAIDAHAAELQSRAPEPLRNAKRGTLHGADGPRLDMGGMIWWDKPHCDAFRRVLVHPKLIPYYEALCGRGYRLDHQPLVIQQERNSEADELLADVFAAFPVAFSGACLGAFALQYAKKARPLQSTSTDLPELSFAPVELQEGKYTVSIELLENGAYKMEQAGRAA